MPSLVGSEMCIRDRCSPGRSSRRPVYLPRTPPRGPAATSGEPPQRRHGELTSSPLQPVLRPQVRIPGSRLPRSSRRHVWVQHRTRSKSHPASPRHGRRGHQPVGLRLRRAVPRSAAPPDAQCMPQDQAERQEAMSHPARHMTQRFRAIRGSLGTCDSGWQSRLPASRRKRLLPSREWSTAAPAPAPDRQRWTQSTGLPQSRNPGWRLRTLYEAANLGFSTEGALCSGSTAAYLVRERELPYSTHETVGVASDEKREVVIATRNRKYRGNPLMLEIVASCDVPDGSSPLDVRPDLEACTARLAALLTWALPGVVGVRLADALFCRDAETLDGSWTWFDVAPIR